MRVTNHLITRSTIARLQRSQAHMAEAQARVTSGKRIERMSDDPSGASSVMQMSGSLRAVAQYRRNVESVSSRLAAEDSALDQVTQLLTRAKEIAVGQLGPSGNAESRRAAAAEVRELLTQAVDVGNGRFGDEFLFGGATSAAAAPFDHTQTLALPRFARLAPPPAPPAPPGPPTAIVPQGARAVEVGPGKTMGAGHDGDAVFLQTGVFDALHDLQLALEANSTDLTRDAMNDVDAAFDDVQALVGDVGARQNHTDSLLAGFETLKLNLEESRGEISEVEMEEAITEMMSRQTAYQAAMLAASKVMGMSLMDYLR